MLRRELKKLRNENNLTQAQMAKRLAMNVSQYNMIENGKRKGSQSFWLDIQREFKLSDAKMWILFKE